MEPNITQWVNVYFVDRCYGGPEEGGWYYDHFTCTMSMGVATLDAAQALHRHLKNEVIPKPERPLHSVLSEGEYRVHIEDEKAASQTLQRPVYS